MECGRHSRLAMAAVGCLILAVLGVPGTVRADFTYTDGSFGLSLRLPDGTAVGRMKSPAGETGTEIGQFTLPDGNTAGRLVVSDLPTNWTYEKAVALVREQLARDTKLEAERITAEKVRVQGNHKNATLLQAWWEAEKLHNAILIVQGPNDQMLLLYIAIRNSDSLAAAKAASRLAEGFSVLLQPEDEETVRVATRRGDEMLLSIAAPPPGPDIFWKEQHFLVQSGQTPYGYIVITETPHERKGKAGLAVRSEKWIFLPNGTAEYESQAAFATWDLQEDEWVSHSEIASEAPGQPPKLVKLEQRVLRLGTQMLLEATDPKNPDKKINRVVPCPRTMMPAAWRWILPRLLMQEKPGRAGDWTAVVMYSPVRRGLETQMFSRVSHGTIRQVLQREGLYGETETWQFDVSGQLRRIHSESVDLVATSAEEAKRLFGGRIAEWRQKLSPKKK